MHLQAATESVSSSAPDDTLTAFVELETAIHEFAVDAMS